MKVNFLENRDVEPTNQDNRIRLLLPSLASRINQHSLELFKTDTSN